VIVGHLSGAVLALEALVAAPSAFAGAVLYEPPCVIGPPLGGEALGRAQAAIAAGKPGTALAVFVRDIVRMSAWTAPNHQGGGGTLTSDPPMARHQIDDCAAIDELGNRLDTYVTITVPTMGHAANALAPGELIDVIAGFADRVLRRYEVFVAQRDSLHSSHY
jgi:hypothetical protein